MSFLPKDYKVPEGESRYYKFEEGENRFRVLDSAIVGYELWVEGKPIRKLRKEDFTASELKNADINKFSGNRKIPMHFWFFPIFDYKTKNVRLLEVTQISIMRGMNDFLNDEDYGSNPKEYDFVVTRDESSDKVEYRVKAKPPKPLEAGIMKLYEDMEIDLQAIFKGEDPFGKGEEKVDPDKVEV